MISIKTESIALSCMCSTHRTAVAYIIFAVDRPVTDTSWLRVLTCWRVIPYLGFTEL